MTLTERLLQHDFAYEYSDNHATWTRGHEQFTAILTMITDPQALAVASMFAERSPDPDGYLRSLQLALERNTNGTR